MKYLEDDFAFNAGHGSVLNKQGKVEMDAILMDGRTLNFGAVAGVGNISNPISLARMVLERTEHVMLIGEGANQFAREMGMPEIDPTELVSEKQLKNWEQFSKYRSVVNVSFNTAVTVPKMLHTTNQEDTNKAGKERKRTHPSLEGGEPEETAMTFPAEKQAKQDEVADQLSPEESGHDTVGAVAIDLNGDIAAATSTGGITLKLLGRVGDSAMVGSGAYCDNNTGGVSCTGHGESIARVLLAHRALSLVEFCQEEPQQALEKALKYMLKHTSGRGGMIMVDKEGRIAKSFSTSRMAWASVDQFGTMESGIDDPRLCI